MEIDLNEAASRDDVLAFVKAIVEGEPNINANLANLAALLNQYLPRINWVGFYLLEESSQEWVLGPFAGKPACTRIAAGRGVVGSALAQDRTLVVDDVTAFPGHIACDADSRSEIVVPLRAQGRIVGCLDVDSPEPGRFSADDARFLEVICERLGRFWPQGRWY